MNDALVQVLLVGLFALACGGLALAWFAAPAWSRRQRSCSGSRWSSGSSTSLAIVSGVGDADNFAVCTEDCAGMHYSVVVGFLAPPLLIALASFAGIVALEQRRRARRAQ